MKQLSVKIRRDNMDKGIYEDLKEVIDKILPEFLEKLPYTRGGLEMEWINFKDQKPKEDIVALVHNCKGWMYLINARYNHRTNTWILADSSYRESLTLEVTHYLPIPEYPKQERPE